MGNLRASTVKTVAISKTRPSLNKSEHEPRTQMTTSRRLPLPKSFCEVRIEPHPNSVTCLRIYSCTVQAPVAGVPNLSLVNLPIADIINLFIYILIFLNSKPYSTSYRAQSTVKQKYWKTQAGDRIKQTLTHV